MRIRSLQAAVLAASAWSAPASHGEVSAQFIEPEKFTDLSLSGSTTENVQRHSMEEITKYVQHLGDTYLPESRKVEISFLDIDMEGEYEPWRTPI